MSMFILLLHDSSLYIFVGVLCQHFVYLSQVHLLQYIWGVSPYRFFYCLKGNNHKIVGPRGTKAHWVNTSFGPA